MNPNVLWIVLAVVAVAAVVVAWFVYQRWRSKRLRARFGSEYDRALKEAGDPRRGEAQLEAREKRVAKLEIRPLSSEDQARFLDA